MAAPASPLSDLNRDLGDLYNDIDYFSTPLKDVHDALSALERIEKTPNRMKGKVKEIHSVLSNLQKACKAATWLPEVGEEAKVAAETLGSINTVLGEVQTVLGDIQKDVDKATEAFFELKKPVDTSWAAIANVEGFLERAETVTADLLKHYEGYETPASVNRCAAALDQPLAPIVRPLNDAKDQAQSALNAAERAGEAVLNALTKAVDFSDFIETVYAGLKPIRNAIHAISSALAQLAHYGEATIKSFLALGEKLGGKTYRKIKGFLDQIDREFHKLKKKFTDWAFKPIRDAMKKARDMLQDALGKLPDFNPAKAAMAAVQALLAQIEQAINSLASTCADLFSGKTPIGSAA